MTTTTKTNTETTTETTTKTTLEKTITEASNALAKAGLPKAEIVVNKDYSMGLLSTNCFHAARELKKNPVEIAKETVKKIDLKKTKYLRKAVAVGGYINFHVSPQYYSESVNECLTLETRKKPNGKKAVIEFSQPNVGKPFHVGHIRSTILGDVVSNLLEETGWSVVRMNYFGDAGSQVAKLILATQVLKNLPVIHNEKDLLAYYIEIHKKIEEDPELSEKARGILEKIEAGDPEISKTLQMVREKSYEAFDRNYALLGIKFDEAIGESDFVQKSKAIVTECVKKGIAQKEPEGEIIALLEPTLPNLVILRSNGTTLYSTRDLALADYKYAKYKFDYSLILTSSEQNLYFKQIITLLQKLGKKYADSYKHSGFGLIMLQDGKMSSREGKVVFLEDVLNEAVALAEKQIKNKDNFSKKEIAGVSNNVGIGAVKFAILRISSEKNISFTLEKVVSFDGDTGAYVQYTCVRAKNILRKAKEAKIKIEAKTKPETKTSIETDEEQKLSATLSQFHSTIENCAESKQVHPLCDYLLKLSGEFSEFYVKHQVLNAETPELIQTRLALTLATASVLEKGLNLLGIHVPEKM